MKAWQHVYPQTRIYHFMDGSQRKFENVQDVVMSAWEHIWLPGGVVVNINPTNVRYTVCEPNPENINGT